MSYSRWSNSRWYTFWSADDTITNKDKEVFTICELDGDVEFTYKQISTSVDKCLKEVSKKLECKDDELEELKIYMKRFKMDVDDEYRSY